MEQQRIDGVPKLRAELSQYHTPQKLAKHMVEWSGAERGMHVLEPSAGGGNIVRELISIGCSVTAFEVDPDWCYQLRMNCPDAIVYNEDFLEDGIPADLAVMNPPLNNGFGLRHVDRALRFVPRVVTLLRTQDLHGSTRWFDFWRNHEIRRLAILSHRPRFGGEYSPKADFVVVEIAVKIGTTEHQTIEHWPDRWV